MKKIFLLLVLLFVSSCAQKEFSSEVARNPSAESLKAFKSFRECGEVSYSESTYNAINPEDIMYNMALDCNRDLKVDDKDQFLSIGIPIEQIRPGQKRWIKSFTRKAIMAKKEKNAKPYMCIKFKSVDNPCLSRRSSVGYQPEFIGNVSNVFNVNKIK